MKRVIRLKWPGYPADVVVATGSPTTADVQGEMLRDGECEPVCVSGMFFNECTDSGRQLLLSCCTTVLWFKDEEPSVPVIVHECFHAVMDYLPMLSIPWTADAHSPIQEVYAYAIESLVSLVVEATRKTEEATR